MRRNLLLVLTLFSFIFSFGQFDLTINGSPVTNGDDFTVTEVGSASEMTFIFTNTNPSSTIRTLVGVENITNGSGLELTLCYNICYFGVSSGSSYPVTPVELTAGQSSAPVGNSLKLSDDPGITYPTDSELVFDIKFFEVDDRGDEIGTPINITYRYNPTLSTEDEISEIPFFLYPTAAEDNITLDVQENVTMNVYSVQGQLVLTKNVLTGNNAIDVSTLASQLYFVEITNQEGKSSKTKFIKK